MTMIVRVRLDPLCIAQAMVAGDEEAIQKACANFESDLRTLVSAAEIAAENRALERAVDVALKLFTDRGDKIADHILALKHPEPKG